MTLNRGVGNYASEAVYLNKYTKSKISFRSYLIDIDRSSLTI